MIIDANANLYTDDMTKLYVGQRKVGEVKVTSDIRQGCTGSPLLFVVLIIRIIKQTMKSQMGFENDKFYIPVLFYADDGLILSNIRKEMAQVMSVYGNGGRM